MPKNGTGNPWKCEMKVEDGRGNKRYYCINKYNYFELIGW